MPHISINGSRLYVESSGEGEPVVLVHGSWSSHTTWQFVAPELSRTHHVVTYDRLGHSDSDRPDVPYARTRHEDDLIALIEAIGRGPVHLVGNSYGAVVVLAVAGRRPDLVRSVLAHEPPAVDHADDAHVTAARDVMYAIAARIDAGDVEDATKRFFEELALGPGGWAMLPENFRALVVGNAPTFAAEIREPGWGTLDLEAVGAYPGRILLSSGDKSPAWFPPTVEAVAAGLPQAGRVVMPGAGHGPHNTHPAEFTALVAAHVGEGDPLALAHGA